MIAFVKGQLEDISEENAVIDVGNMGINVKISARTASLLPNMGKTVKLFTYTLVREDTFNLYGFLTRDDLDIFKRLIAVNGICNILNQSGINTIDKIRIVQQDDVTQTTVATPGLIQTGRITGYLWRQYAQLQTEFLCHHFGEPPALDAVIVCRHVIYFDLNHIVGRISAFRSASSRRIVA